MNILVIGGCGYIGSRLYEYLKTFHSIDTVDLEWYGNTVNKANLRQDYHELTRDFYSSYDVIILLAGHTSVKLCQDNGLSVFRNNVRNFVDLLDKIRDDQIFIYASSSSIYNKTETSKNYYDVSKQHIDDYSMLSSRKYFGLRFGTVNGFSPNFRKDLMMNAMVYNALVKKKVVCFNPDINRPILNIEDLCKAVQKIIQCDSFNDRGVYNLTSFNSTPRKLSKIVSEYLDVDLEITPSGGDSYDFTMNSNEFGNVFEYSFNQDVHSIINSIVDNFDKIDNIEGRFDARLY